MAETTFAVTWDYRCPFARNAHEYVVAGLEHGAPWSVTFVPFSLNQVHVPEGGPSVWDNEAAWPDLLALEAGVVIRDRYPDAFLSAHRALFSVRHDEGGDLRDPAVLRRALEGTPLPLDQVFGEIAEGWPREQIQKEHEAAVAGHAVFGVPTFILGDRAAFVRLMDRPEGDGARARSVVEHVLSLCVEHPELNEFKHTTVSR
jgi:hypothetical protein